MTYNSSQEFETFLPAYDAVPPKWEDARPFIVEQLKDIANAVNIRTIGWKLDQELLNGEQFIPTTSQSQEYRSVFRKVVNCSPLVAGANTFAHGIKFDARFTLLHLYIGATNSSTFLAQPIPNGTSTVTMDAVNLNINSTGAFDRAFATIEYCLEI